MLLQGRTASQRGWPLTGSFGRMPLSHLPRYQRACHTARCISGEPGTSSEEALSMYSRGTGLGRERQGGCMSSGNVPKLFWTALRCAEPAAPGLGSMRRRSPFGSAVLGGQQVVLRRLPPPRPGKGARQFWGAPNTSSADTICFDSMKLHHVREVPDAQHLSRHR